jgi:hypothetical protein
MNLKALTAAGIAVLTLIVGAGLQSQSVFASTPPGQDHAFGVVLSTTTAGANPDIDVNLVLCTDGSGIALAGHECTASTPAEPFFDQATANYFGIALGAQANAAVVATISFDIETNGGVTQAAGPDAGQRADCGSVAHIAPPSFQIFSGVKTGTVVSMDPDPSHPGFGFDQVDDPSEPNGGDVVNGNGWPTGIKQLPAVVPAVQALAGIPNAAVISRGYGDAVIAFGVNQTTVTFLTIALGGNPVTAGTANLTLLGNPLGAASSAAQSTTTCPPFFSSVHSYGTSLASNTGKAMDGTPLTGPLDFTPSAVGAVNNTICSVSCTGGYSYNILLSSGGDDDSDGVTNAADDCPTVPDPAQTSFAGIGTACAAGQGYANNNAGALAALAGCSVATSCTDIDGDGFLNAADNCPFVANPTQKNNDGDGRGDACEGTGADPTIAPMDNPIASVKGDGNGYGNGNDPGMVTSGQLNDHSDICKVAFTPGGTTTPPTVCLAFGPTNTPPGPGYVWQDSNNDGIPDFLCAGTCTSANVTRDHKADANGDGYSDADEGTPANCGTTSCGSISTLGTAETNSCRNAGRNCGTGAATTWDPLTRAKDAPGGPGTGCLKTLDATTSLKTTNLAKSDVDLDGSVSILDLSKIASWFGNPVGPANDPRWEGNMDGDGSISILDLSAAASNFGRSVNGNCLIQ